MQLLDFIWLHLNYCSRNLYHFLKYQKYFCTPRQIFITIWPELRTQVSRCTDVRTDSVLFFQYRTLTCELIMHARTHAMKWNPVDSGEKCDVSWFGDEWCIKTPILRETNHLHNRCDSNYCFKSPTQQPTLSRNFDNVSPTLFLAV